MTVVVYGDNCRKVYQTYQFLSSPFRNIVNTELFTVSNLFLPKFHEIFRVKMSRKNMEFAFKCLSDPFEKKGFFAMEAPTTPLGAGDYCSAKLSSVHAHEHRCLSLWLCLHFIHFRSKSPIKLLAVWILDKKIYFGFN